MVDRRQAGDKDLLQEGFWHQPSPESFLVDSSRRLWVESIRPVGVVVLFCIAQVDVVQEDLVQVSAHRADYGHAGAGQGRGLDAAHVAGRLLFQHAYLSIANIIGTLSIITSTADHIGNCKNPRRRRRTPIPGQGSHTATAACN